MLTEREIFTEKYRNDVFFARTEPAGRGLYKKTGAIFLGKDWASKINKKFIIWHKACICTRRNARIRFNSLVRIW